LDISLAGTPDNLLEGKYQWLLGRLLKMTNNLITKSGHGCSSGENVARSSIILFLILFM